MKKITQLTKVILVVCLAFISTGAFSQTVLIEEIFDIDGGEVDSDSADFSAMPTDWMVTNCYSSGKNNYDLSDTDETSSILFKSNTSSLTTPAINKPGVLTFWGKDKGDLNLGESLKISKSVDGGDYVLVDSIIAMTEEYAEYSVTIDDLSSNVKIKFSSYSGDDINEYKFYLDYIIIKESTATGIFNASAAQELTILGNYVESNLTFETNSSVGQLFVVDMIGRVVMQDAYSGSKTINVSNLKSGSYILMLNDASGKQAAKFYKQ